MHILTAIPTFDSANFDVPSTGTKISAQKTRPAVPNNILDKLLTVGLNIFQSIGECPGDCLSVMVKLETISLVDVEPHAYNLIKYIQQL